MVIGILDANCPQAEFNAFAFTNQRIGPEEEVA
jgi:hypothetical protein